LSSEQEQREQLIQELRENGENPFQHNFDRTHTVNELTEHEGTEESDLPDEELRTAGRIMEIRNFGGIAFLDLRGEQDEIQVVLRDEEHLEQLENLQNGDIVGVAGELSYTQKEEFSLEASVLEILTKAVNPVPSSYYGLEDQETQYRQRSLHLIDNMDARDSFRDRSTAISEMRRFLEDEGFMEVETPVIQPVYGGANARPFTTHVNDKDMEAYLRIAPELYLKRLIIGGYERVFEIGKNFRNESIDTTHNPEYTAMELYQAYADYEDMMRITEELVEHITREVTGGTTVEYRGEELDMSAPWRRMTMREALIEYGGFDVEELNDGEIRELMDEYGAELESEYERGLAIAELFEEVAEEELIQPTFITDYPRETTPLCKIHRENEDLIERFEGFAAGMELANAYTELRDPLQQEQHFQEEQQRAEEGDEEAHEMDEDFIEALRHGMPPTGGLGIGVDRLVMLLTDSESIRDVIFFPMMK
jgi:lysyl-tRNA synthetase class 2